MTQESSAAAAAAAEARSLRIGIEAEPQLRGLAEQLAAELGEELGQRFSEIEWSVELGRSSFKDPQARIAELVREARRMMLERGWDLVICLTDIPMLRDDGRPLIAHASATDGVALISVPALGVIDVESRLLDAAFDAIAALVGAATGSGEADDHHARVRDRLTELASPLGVAEARDDSTVSFSSAVLLGNLRLLFGMVRANRPWRVAARLSRSLVAALGTAAYVVASVGFWTLAGHMTWPRLLGLSLVALVLTSVALIVVHGLWERSTRPQTRERVVLFNAVTTLTIAIGVLTLYLGLFAFNVVAAFGLIPPDAFGSQIGRHPTATDYLHLAWLDASLATLAGALGSLVDGDLAVREAAYGYRSTAGEVEDARD
jgi:hypothetical protein